jgi:hypothetical protein
LALIAVGIKWGTGEIDSFSELVNSFFLAFAINLIAAVTGGLVGAFAGFRIAPQLSSLFGKALGAFGAKAFAYGLFGALLKFMEMLMEGIFTDRPILPDGWYISVLIAFVAGAVTGIVGHGLVGDEYVDDATAQFAFDAGLAVVIAFFSYIAEMISKWTGRKIDELDWDDRDMKRAGA